ncbi:putative bifunctional diguanylate cyclase/phosphodiesterase [Martelella limonii]|uniref:putative bifunctional diguanylate cyclase/phosphodiesterase n=1 Tax=Martelella limonii TaxID=1647649 RepID=UPI0015801EEA|nr:EAL domain-containing protein [Martelella limonii]
MYRAFAAAFFVALVGGYLTMSLIVRVRSTPIEQAWIWLLLSGAVGGMTIWCTHFSAMLGYDDNLPHVYDPALTFLSLAIAVIMTTAGVFVFYRGGRKLPVELGGAIVGAGIALMHFVGMAGYDGPGRYEWSWGFVAASIVLGILFSTLAFSAPVRMRALCCQMVATSFFILAIFSVHFISMIGMEVVNDGSIPIPGEGLSSQTMTFFTAQGISVVVIVGLALLIIEAKNREQVDRQVTIAGAHDGLTGLPNRRSFSTVLERLIDEGSHGNSRFAVGFLDIIGFKEINDVHGHSAGDHILRHVARGLVEQLPSDCFVARVGDDEFAVILKTSAGRVEVARTFRRALDEIARPIVWEGTSFEVKLHCGFTGFPTDGNSTYELIARIDVALQRAKRGGANSIVFYDVRRDHGERRLNALALDMRRALEEGEFRLFYQQQRLTETREIFGFEVLLRWFHKDLGLISPDEFIPLAERTGFIGALGEWVLRQACLDGATWRNPFQIGVNVSASQLADARFPRKVEAILRETGFPPERLELEFTESGLVEDGQRAHDSISALKRLGVKIAMDDFGTGYSSLATLQQFPFDKIKIDRSFVAGLPGDELSAAIVRATVIISRSLGIRVLAEGVETEEQLEFLHREHCLRAQGYYFGKPEPRSAIEAVVNGNDIAVPVQPPVRSMAV